MFLTATLVGWIGGDFVCRKMAAKNTIVDEMASPGNQHRASCIGTLSLGMLLRWPEMVEIIVGLPLSPLTLSPAATRLLCYSRVSWMRNTHLHTRHTLRFVRNVFLLLHAVGVETICPTPRPVSRKRNGGGCKKVGIFPTKWNETE